MNARSQEPRSAVFLDRDGVINVFPGAGEFVKAWAEFRFMPGVATQLRRLREAGFALVLVTNQSGVGRGLMSLADLRHIHKMMQKELGEDALDAIYFCPHHPDEGCECRKPSPRMIQAACREHGLDPAKSFVIGDSGRDIEMGHAAGCVPILCRKELPSRENLKPKQRPDAMFRTLAEAVDWIVQFRIQN